jgi:hypothetical protein
MSFKLNLYCMCSNIAFFTFHLCLPMICTISCHYFDTMFFDYTPSRFSMAFSFHGYKSVEIDPLLCVCHLLLGI